MASDERFYGGPRIPFHAIKATADATTNGVEVVAAAATGESHYVSGWAAHNDTAGALVITLYHTAGAAGKTQISIGAEVAANSTQVINYLEPLAVGTAKNLGIVASGAGAVEVEIWGYTK